MATIFQKFRISTAGSVLSLVISFATVVGLGISIVNFFILNSIQPVLAHIESTDKALAVETLDRQTADTVTNNTVDQGFKAINIRFDDLIIRLNAISTRVTSIDNALLKR